MHVSSIKIPTTTKTICLTRTEQYHTPIYVPIISVQLKYLTPFETDTLMKTSSVVTCYNE